MSLFSKNEKRILVGMLEEGNIPRFMALLNDCLHYNIGAGAAVFSRDEIELAETYFHFKEFEKFSRLILNGLGRAKLKIEEKEPWFKRLFS